MQIKTKPRQGANAPGFIIRRAARRRGPRRAGARPPPRCRPGAPLQRSAGGRPLCVSVCVVFVAAAGAFLQSGRAGRWILLPQVSRTVKWLPRFCPLPLKKQKGVISHDLAGAALPAGARALVAQLCGLGARRDGREARRGRAAGRVDVALLLSGGGAGGALCAAAAHSVVSSGRRGGWGR